METLIINGGERLAGEITVSGSKNAALPIIFATLLTRGESRLSNIPDISDVAVALDIIASFGVTVERVGNTVTVNTERLVYKRPDDALVSRIRASTYLLGASLSRFGIAELQGFGGCNFSARPIDLHIAACTAFGGTLTGDKIISHGLSGAHIRFPKVSVGATVNAILLAVSARGVSVIENYAKEPHIFNLIEYLTSAGADITVSEGSIVIKGKELRGGSVTVEGDTIEAGTYAALSLLTGGGITVKGANPENMSAFFEPFLLCGARLDTEDGIRLYGEISSPVDITTAPYPGFPTDLQPIAATILAVSRGGVIEDRVWEDRFGYLSSVEPFGVRFSRYPHGAVIHSSQISPASTAAPDLRGGAAALLLALFAKGESRIASAEIIRRGYEKIEEKLTALGAFVNVENN